MAEEYQKLIEQAEASLYGTKRILLPAPQCIVFYNGKQDMPEALNVAISYCIDHDILSDFLKKYQAEVLGMLLEEFDVEKYERTIKEEGIEYGQVRINLLYQKLKTDNRIEELMRAIDDAEYRDCLLDEYGL